MSRGSYRKDRWTLQSIISVMGSMETATMAPIAATMVPMPTTAVVLVAWSINQHG